jgi:hypothetical protein
MFRLACILGEFRLNFIQKLRRCDAASAMNETNSCRPRLRFADSLAAAVIADPVVSVTAKRAYAELTERIANVSAAGLFNWDVEGDRDWQRKLRMRARGGRNESPVRGWRRRATFGGKRGLIAPPNAGCNGLLRAEERQWYRVNGRGWFEWRSHRSGREQ